MKLLVSFVFLATLTAIQVSVVVPVQHYSNGWFQAEICFLALQPQQNWTIVLTSDQAISYFFAPSAHVAQIKDEGRTFVLENRTSGVHLQAGTRLAVPVEGHVSGTSQPSLRATLQGVSASGC
ncbi:hypothetical protein Btru_073855 [Bulinus truncatus]|nr:hypothetical protein Btru_073855 [Bulinus truncatus]